MCETMGNIPMEDNSSYVLTEDMIDAAMTEHFSTQDDGESEDELNSPDYSMDMDLIARVTTFPEINDSEFSSLHQKSSNDSVTADLDSSSRAVVVIETGLNKSNEILVENNGIDDVASTSKTNQACDISEKTISAPESVRSTNNLSVNAKLNKKGVNRENKEPLLKSILNNPNNIESIDLCNSDTDSNSEDEYTEAETLDNELQSVMESNLRAEIGISSHNKVSNSSLDPMSSLELQVQNVTQISPSTFKNMSEIGGETCGVQKLNQKSKVDENIPKTVKLSNFVLKAKEPPNSIHFNKIAIPHQTYVNKQGQKMKCVYVRNTLTPVLINSNQPSSTSTSSVRCVMAKPQAKNPTRVVSPSELFANINSRPVPYNQSVQSYNSLPVTATRMLQISNQPTLSASKPVFFNNQLNAPASKSNLVNNQVNFQSGKSMLASNQQTFPINKPLSSFNQPSFEASPPIFSNNQSTFSTQTNLTSCQFRLPTNLPNLPVKRTFSTTNLSPSSASNAQFETNDNHQFTLHYKPNNKPPQQQLVRTPGPGQVAPIRSSSSDQLDEREIVVIKSLLFHNLKKPYNPLKIRDRTTLFICPDCNDRFIVQSSLTNHLSRRSLVIRYWCTKCLLDLHFFNRCAFMRHLRSHKQSIAQMDYSKISVNPLPLDMIQGGVVSSFFIENPDDSSLPIEDCIISKPKDVLRNFEMVKQTSTTSSSMYSSSPSSKETSSSSLVSTISPAINQSRNNQPLTSLLLNKTVTPQFAFTSKAIREESLIPANFSTNPGFASALTSQTQTNDLKSDSTKSVSRKVVVLVDKKNKSVNLSQTAKLNVLPPNELFSVSESDVVGDSNPGQTNTVLEDDEIDVDTLPVKNGSNSTSPVHSVGNGSHSLSFSPNVDNGLTSKSSLIVGDKKTSGKTAKQHIPAVPTSAFKRVLCYDCGTSCMNISKHLNGNGRPSNANLACTRCELILPTKCALKSHIRVHDKFPPYKCPDCGKDFQAWKELYSHLKFSCGHFAKCVRYKCLSCKFHFPSKSVLGHHLVTKHTRTVFKCSSCPVAFYNKSSIDHHMLTTAHREEAVVLSNHKLCELCPKKLLLLDEFVSHIHQHTNSNVALIYGYKCPMCTLTFANKTTFVVHQLKEKSEQSTQENSNSDFEFVAHFPIEDSSSTAEKDPLSTDSGEIPQDQRVNEKREELCIVCKKNYVYLLPGININEQSLCCKQCVKPLDVDYTVDLEHSKTNNKSVSNTKKKGTSSSLKFEENAHNFQKAPAKPTKRKSTDEKHFTAPKRPRKSGVRSQSVDSNMELSTNFNPDFSQPKKKNRNKNTNRQKIDCEGPSSHIQGQVISFKSPNELSCARCNFVADTKDNFLEHIADHRTDPNTYQCLECGLCFVVLPSLERHLQMHHGIKSVNDYIKQNKSSVPKKFEETQRLQENQCRVCLEVFDSNSSLEKHFRTHGMAFMNSLRKSP